jgi:hypothetical protein
VRYREFQRNSLGASGDLRGFTVSGIAGTVFVCVLGEILLFARDKFRNALAYHFELGLGAGALGNGRFDRLLLFLARRVETGTPGIERTAFLVVLKSIGIDLGLAWQSRPAGRRKRRCDRSFNLREHRFNLGAGRRRVVGGFEAFQLGKNSAPAVFEFAPPDQLRVSLGNTSHASGFQKVGPPRIEIGMAPYSNLSTTERTNFVSFEIK